MSSSRSLVPLALCALTVLGCGGPLEEWAVNEGSWAVHTVCGGASTVEGIDVSKWQATVSWPQVKGDGIVFAFARVSDGLNYPDAYFADNWTGMKQAGIIRGVYQFFRPSQDALAQANYLIQEVNDAGGLQAGDLPPVLDLEKTEGMSSSAILAKVDTWLDAIEQAFNRTPIIYSGSYFWDDNIFSSSYASYPLWIPHYTSQSCPLVPDPWQEWAFWQYTDSASVSGVSGNADANRFNGSLSDLQAFIASSVIQPSQPSPPPASDAGTSPSSPTSSPHPPIRDMGQPDMTTVIIHDSGLPSQDQGTPAYLDGGVGWPDGELPPTTHYNGPRPIEGCAVGGPGGSAGDPPVVLVLALILILCWGRGSSPRSGSVRDR